MSEQKKESGFPVFDRSKMIPFKGVQIAAVSSETDPPFTPAKMKQVAESYDPKFREAPITITHEAGRPKSWASFGWIEKVWTDGKKLFSDWLVHPKLVEVFEQGLTKTWSIHARYEPTLKSMYLQHLALLGADLPAIPGMPELTYVEEAEGEEFFFASDQNWKHLVTAGVFQKVRDLFIEQYGVEEADRIISQWNIDELNTPPPPNPDELDEAVNFKKENELSEKIYTQENVDNLILAAVGKAEIKFKADHDAEIVLIRAEVDTEKTKIVALEKDKTTLEGDVLKFSNEATKAKIETDVNALIGDGRIHPKQKDEISLSLTGVRSLGEEAYNAQLGIYKAMTQMSFGADGKFNGPGPEPTINTYSMVDGLPPQPEGGTQ